MDGRPPFRDGAVLFAGSRIAAVGPARDLMRQIPQSAVYDCGPDTLLLPGLVNAHVHLELSHLTPGPPPPDPASWLLNVIRAAPQPGFEGDDAVRIATEFGIAECLRFGVTTVGDITTRPAVTRAALARSPLSAVSYGEVRAMAARRTLLEPRIEAALDPTNASDTLHVGLSPHAPYSIEAAGYQRCLDLARRAGLPLTTHLAEFAEEAEFLDHHTGPFRQLWDALSAWDDQVPRIRGGPIQLAHALGLLDYPGCLLAHVNYCTDADLDLLARGRAGVVYCPRTHAYFGHPPHRWRDMLARGINVAVGTDSRASSPDLNLLDDLRHLRRLAPDVPPLMLWELATSRAARAIGLSGLVGSLEPGKRADAVVFPATGPDPLADVFDRDLLPREFWSAGRRN